MPFPNPPTLPRSRQGGARDHRRCGALPLPLLQHLSCCSFRHYFFSFLLRPLQPSSRQQGKHRFFKLLQGPASKTSLQLRLQASRPSKHFCRRSKLLFGSFKGIQDFQNLAAASSSRSSKQNIAAASSSSLRAQQALLWAFETAFWHLQRLPRLPKPRCSFPLKPQNKAPQALVRAFETAFWHLQSLPTLPKPRCSFLLKPQNKAQQALL